ncbi:hypothetical protein [Leptospira levettii]|uniref:hypothetical protein n=1 Tax=Leptospira levettii TaxID=2023178 RepID=UPI000C2A6060|nr:hypothetical protein [Leptospira levettii]PJZ89530.1 hypothetical protein CH368_06115 [Leptospira levettii]
MNIEKLKVALEVNVNKKPDLSNPSEEIAEIILDKIHLQMSKELPGWQEIVLENETDTELPEINQLMRKHFERILKANNISGTPEWYRGMAKEFYSLNAEYLGRYCSSKADYVFAKIKKAVKGSK